MEILLRAFFLICLLAGPSAWAMGSKTEARKEAPPVAAEMQLPVPEPKTPELLSITRSDGVRHDFQVEVVSEPLDMAYGLMNRTSMDPDHGMLFLFREEGPRSFWMKNTLIPLDILFIDANGVVRNIGHGKPNDLTSIPSDGDVLHVLEINGGRAEELGIAAGSVIHHPLFGNELAQ